MFFRKAKKELALVRAFQKVFCGEGGELSAEGEAVLSFLRGEAGARGELGSGGTPYFYDAQNRFDANAAAFLLGKRRMFDLIVKYLALDERKVFALCGKEEQEEAGGAEADLRRALEA